MTWTVEDVKNSDCFDVAVSYVCQCGDEYIVPVGSGIDVRTEATCPNCGWRLILSVPYSDSAKRAAFLQELTRTMNNARNLVTGRTWGEEYGPDAA